MISRWISTLTFLFVFCSVFLPASSMASGKGKGEKHQADGQNLQAVKKLRAKGRGKMKRLRTRQTTKNALCPRSRREQSRPQETKKDPRFLKCGTFDMGHTVGESGRTFLNVLQQSVELAELVYFPEEKIKQEYPDAVVTEYPPRKDRTAVIQSNDVCFAVFRGTDPTSPVDILQNIDPNRTTLCGTQDESACCEVREGFARTANAPGLEECKSDCPSCEVVVTGHSQGGGIAILSAVVFQQYNPIVIGFGNPGAVLAESLQGDTPCKNIFRDTTRLLPRVYRFINTTPGPVGLRYDPVGFIEGEPTDQTGASSEYYDQVFVLGEMEAENLAHYLRDDEIPETARALTDPAAHSMFNYTDKITSFELPVGAAGFGDGKRCTFDEECQSLACNVGLCMG